MLQQPRFLVLVLAVVLLGVMVSAGRARLRPRQDVSFAGEIVAESADAYVAYDESTHTWEIGSNGILRRMRYHPATGYRPIALVNPLTGRSWLASSSGVNADLHLEVAGQVVVGPGSDFTLQGYQTWTNADGSLELQVSLAREPLMVHLHYVVFPGTSVIEQWAAVENTGQTVLPGLTALDSIFLALRPASGVLTLYWVQGLSPQVENRGGAQKLPTLQLRSLRMTEGLVQVLGSNRRSSEDSMGWFALAAPELHEGLFGGIEWSGAWRLSVGRLSGQTLLRGGLTGFRHDLVPGEVFEAPRRFLGFYRGDLDEAAKASHVFARAYLMRPRPLDFPWTQYNTWYAYGVTLDEATLRREVDAAAESGLEAFVVDAGWYEGSPQQGDFGLGLGTWRENRAKFPSGLAAFSDYVHSKGLKFGLWVEPERVDLNYAGPGREIPLAWLSPEAVLEPGDKRRETRSSSTPMADAGAARTAQVCLGHPEARAWLKTWLTRLIRDYRLDWLKWDNNTWMSCDPPGTIGDGDYAHIQGLYEVLGYLRDEFPNLVIENCASGGNRMDYGLMRRTDIAWLSDETEPSFRVRYHLAGASYPFPPEYLNTWLVDSTVEPLTEQQLDCCPGPDPANLRAWLRSRMMGAFGLSVVTEGWTPEVRTAIAAEIDRYKGLRDILAHSDLYRLLPQTDLTLSDSFEGSGQVLEPPSEPDAAEFYSTARDAGVVFLFQGAIPWPRRRLALKGLDPDALYEVTSADGTLSIHRTGQQLMTQGIRFRYEAGRPSALLFLRLAHLGVAPDPTPTP